MNFFNHEIEYLSTYTYDGIESEYQGKEIRQAIVHYDNLLGVRCKYYFAAPSDLWDQLIVGGTMSAGGVFVPGIVSDVSGAQYTVTSIGFRLSQHPAMPSSERLMIGEKVIIFDHMEHSEKQFGVFTKCITPRLDLGDKLNVHSINVIVRNSDVAVGVIHLDPFDNTPNYDELTLEIAKRRNWKSTDFSYIKI